MVMVRMLRQTRDVNVLRIRIGVAFNDPGMSFPVRPPEGAIGVDNAWPSFFDRRFAPNCDRFQSGVNLPVVFHVIEFAQITLEDPTITDQPW